MTAGRAVGPGVDDPPAVRLDRVSKNFADTAAVDELSLDIRRGEFLTLLGPSGCGKTTTLRLIAGFDVPDSGEVKIAGNRVNETPPYRRNVNTVFQSYALFPHLSVWKNIAYGLTLKRLARKEIQRRVDEVLQRVGLTEKAQHFPRQLSGGQMQRVALARALVNEPEVLLLDEPLGALDAKLRRAMHVELRRMHRDLGMTFMCVTHDQEEALVMSDRIAVMNGGKIAQIGSPQEIYQRPGTQFVADFIGGCNFIPAEIGDGGALLLPDGSVWPMQVRGASRAVTIAVRPPRFTLEPGADGTAYGLTASVLDVIYLGDGCRLILGFAGDIRIVVECEHKALSFARDQALSVYARPEDIVVFERSGEAIV